MDAPYLRVSTEEQRERQTIATQRAFSENYCNINNITVYRCYADDGVSGMIPLDQRPQGAQLLADAKAGKFDTILVYKLDRLGRDAGLILNTVKELESLGVQIKSMTEPFDTSNPSGRFLLTILSAVAGLERDTIIQRSIEGSNRLARDGVWLGGIVPYGYNVVGKDRNSRLVVSEQVIPGFAISYADVIRLIFQMTVEDHKSCVVIADYLNAIGIPPAYVRDGRELRRGKHKSATAGIWRAGRIRSIIVNTTYKGIHQYGKRSKKREVIEREVPAIISVEVWDRAQVILHEHMLFSMRNAKQLYLLKGLIKCVLCGLTYIGIPWKMYNGEKRIYYICNGRHQPKRIYGTKEKKCLSKSVNGTALEEVIWQDIEQFLRHPGDVLNLLAEQIHDRAGEGGHLRDEIAHLQQNQQEKNNEKDAVIALFRRGRIDEADLDRQLDQIQLEEGNIKLQIDRLQELVQDARNVETRLRSAEEMLQTLRKRLEEPPTWDLKRQLVEALVERIWVNTFENEQGEMEAKITVTYRFGVSLEL